MSNSYTKPLSVDQALAKAKSLVKKGELSQAMQSYQAVLEKFPGNKRAIEGLIALTRPNYDQGHAAHDTAPFQKQINSLIALSNQGRLQEALEQGTALAEQYPNAPLILNIIGVVNARLGRLDQAVESFTEALKTKPNFAEAHYNLGITLKALGKHGKAIASFTKALQIKPDYVEAHNDRGNALQALGKHEEAIVSYIKALRIKPDYAEAHNNLGVVQNDLGKHKEAIASYTKSLRIKPDYAEVHNNLGNALNDIGKHEEAIASFTKALQIKPDYAEAHNNLSYALKILGRHEEAIASQTKALQIKPDYAEAQRNLGTLEKYKTDDPRIAQMLEQIANPSISESDKMQLSFALSKAYEDLGDMKNSFQHLLDGNRLRKKDLGYNISSDRKLFGLIKSIFAANNLPTIEGIQTASERRKQPIFIVGMPRSGTTLAEQILASHSNVYGAGEIDALNKVVKPILEDIQRAHAGKLTGDAIRGVRDDYLAELDGFGSDEPRVTDKVPLNFRWIGFILTAMPEAKVINLRRDPVATCWSVFKHYFSSRGNGYAYNLVDVAEYYKLYIELMDFWRKKFPNRIYDLNYEALTENQEVETRKLLDFCNLDWDARCLEFHKTERAVKTASSVQVRQKMYKGSSDAWRRYEPQLQPMLQALNHGQTDLNTAPSQEQIDGLIALYSQGRLQEALELGTALDEKYPNIPLILNILGVVNARLGSLDQSVASLTKALQIEPDFAEAHSNLGNALKALGKHEEAIVSYIKALQIKPDYAEAHYNLGITLKALGKHEEAITSYTKALRIKPDYAEAQCDMGNALKALGKHKEAIARYSKALRIKPDYAEAHNNLGNALNDIGKHEEAIVSYTNALRIRPDYAEAHNNMGVAHTDLGKHEEAIASYSKALQIKPDYAGAQRNLGTLEKYKTDDPRIAQMLEQIANPSISESDKMQLSFALSKAYEDLGDMKNSFQHLLDGNRLRKKDLGYNISSDRKLFGLIKSIFAANNLPTIEGIQTASERRKQPIFIVGMPRSGTTLAEQILASHSNVYGAGEIDALNKVVKPILEDIQRAHAGKLTGDAIRGVRDDYLAELDGFGSDEPRVTDKVPLNFRWIGFILTAMPEAKVINLRRDPVATCWSVFKHYFSSRGNGYAYNLVDVAEYYKLYIELMDFWRKKFPNRIYDLNYEALTENQEVETRKLLDFCNLDWDARCLEFHKTERAVKTASSVQVRQKMYKGSSDAWRRYEPQLQPMLQALNHGQTDLNTAPSQEQIDGLIALYSQGRLQEALELGTALDEKYPNIPLILNILGAVNAALGRLEEAVASYSKALQLKPDFADAYNNMGGSLSDLGKHEEAITSFSKALKIRPDYAEAHCNLGNALNKLGKHAEAITSLTKALQIKPEFAEVHNNLGNALKALGKREEAIASYSKALQIKPDYAEAKSQKIHQQALLCDWAGLESEGSASSLAALGTTGTAVPPLTIFSFEDHPEHHRRRSEFFAAKKSNRTALPEFQRPRVKPDRIRIGYFSADFRNHPVMQLMARVFELHNRGAFGVHAYSYGPPSSDPMRSRLEDGFDVFHDVRMRSDKDIALLARDEGIDIAIDLTGYTQNTRSGIFACRAAPIQVNYLGYPGTLGAPFIDYIVADETLIPKDSQKFYSEKVIYLPHSYQPQDNTTPISDRTPSRTELGLPETGFIFCCFNNTYKISPKEFDIWMRLLHKVEGSVLWLFRANLSAEKNLSKEARTRGIEPERLIFADRTNHPDYLARLRVADLFLDTFNYNAGATASNALWAGLPVLTKMGEGYTARMAGSLLNAIDLPELITTTEEAYEHLALELATNPQKLQTIKGKLQANRNTKPLFDTDLFTRHLEEAYRKIHHLDCEGDKPEHVVISDGTSFQSKE